MMPNLLAMDVAERAQQALSSSPISALRHLRVVQLGNELLISGSVSTYYHKQLAQEAVRAVADGTDVINSIDVL